jgi:hypothetical protein
VQWRGSPREWGQKQQSKAITRTRGTVLTQSRAGPWCHQAWDPKGGATHGSSACQTPCGAVQPYLLVPALDGALAFPEVDAVALPVSKYLNLHVVRPLDVLLHKYLNREGEPGRGEAEMIVDKAVRRR